MQSHDNTNVHTGSSARLISNFMRLVLLLIPVLPVNAQSPRIAETINESWRFLHGSQADATEAGQHIEGTYVDLPHTWNAEDVLDEVPGYFRGDGWYQKEIWFDERYLGKRVYIHFEGANQVTRVFINGISAGEKHIGGYTPFAYDLTSNINVPGQNIITVHVNNAHDPDIIPLEADFNFYGGIYRDVRLICAGEIHFDLLDHGSTGVYITTPSVSEKEADLHIKSRVVNSTTKAMTISLKHRLIDPGSELADSVTTTYTIEPGVTVVEDKMQLRSPELWSIENPALYTLVSEIVLPDGATSDQVVNPVGFRWFRFDSESGFYLNDKYVKLIGSNRHQDYPGIGNALTNEMHRHDMKMLREMGINFLRISHYPHDPAVLEMCNRYGFVATLEIPFVNEISTSDEFLTNSVHMMREAIRSNFNNPCIVAWCTGNETTMRIKPTSVYENRLRRVHIALDSTVRAEDPTRYSYTVAFRSPEYHSSMDFLHTDIIGFNKYFAWYEREMDNLENELESFTKEFEKYYPDKPFILSEYGAGADPRLRSFAPQKFDFSIEYQLEYHRKHLRYILETPRVAGSNIWNFADFQVETRGDAVPHINSKGVVTLDRTPKDSYYFYQVALSEDPLVRIPSKLWKTRSGRADNKHSQICTQPVTIFGNTRRAELFLNNKSLGARDFDFHAATWQVPFTDGKNQLYVKSDDSGVTATDFMEIDFQVQPYDLRSSEYPFNEIAVNVGSNCYFIDDKSNDYQWLPDQQYEPGSWGYTGGVRHFHPYSNTIGDKHDVRGTPRDPIFQTRQDSIKAYQFDVPDGQYELTILLSEFNSGDGSENIFNVFVNSGLLWADVNIKKHYGLNRAAERQFIVDVMEGDGLKVTFEPVKGLTYLNGIKVRRLRP